MRLWWASYCQRTWAARDRKRQKKQSDAFWKHKERTNLAKHRHIRKTNPELYAQMKARREV